MMDPITSTAIAVGLPILTELFKGLGGALSRRFVGLSVDDQIKMWTAEIERIKAIASLDTPVGTPSQWVVDMRASFRYIAAGALIVVGSGTMLYGLTLGDAEVVNLGAQVAGFPFGFIFGERMVLAFKGTPK